MSEESALIFIWTGFWVLAGGGAVACFVWGLRTGQFGDQERARSLPLSAEIPEASREGKKSEV